MGRDQVTVRYFFRLGRRDALLRRPYSYRLSGGTRLPPWAAEQWRRGYIDGVADKIGGGDTRP